jgi:hypothetical protein
VDRHNRVGAIVLASENASRFGGVESLIEAIETRGNLGGDILAALGPFDQHAEIVLLFCQGIDQVDFVLKPLSSLEGSLGFRLIIPEFRLGDALLELADFVPRPSCLKDNS